MDSVGPTTHPALLGGSLKRASLAKASQLVKVFLKVKETQLLQEARQASESAQMADVLPLNPVSGGWAMFSWVALMNSLQKPGLEEESGLRASARPAEALPAECRTQV